MMFGSGSRWRRPVELHHQVLPRLAGEALLLGQGAMPYRSGSVP
jgi:hypothetical protein